MKTVGICTLGCKVNTYESEFIINELKKNDYEIKDFNDICDIYIINTCTVTNTSDIKSRKMIRSAINRNKDALVIAMGCFIEANHDFNEDGVSIYLGNKDKSRIIELIDNYYENKEIVKDFRENELTKFEDMFITNFPGRTRAFVKIQDGCENFCSYCIIPFVRGKCRSKDFDKVIEEVKSLVENGYKEVVLTGIHTGNYGVDKNTNFATLLKELVKIEGLDRLRISSIEVTELTDEVLDVIKNNPKIVDHMHIPLQAGSDKILKLMNRKYDLEYFKDKINKIRSIRPNISITTDIIVGFPEENEEDFNNTLETVKEINFSKVHVFPYSLRSGTVAFNMKNQVDGNIKKERARRLLELSKKQEIDYFNKFINKDVEVLIENNRDGYSYGHTGNYLHVKVEGTYKSNTYLTVNLKEVEYPYIKGDVCE